MRAERTIAAVTWRLLMGRRRWLLAVFANALPVLVAWLFVTQGDNATRAQALNFFTQLMTAAVMTVLLPLAGLIHGTSAFGTELDDGTLRYILAKPVERWRIVLAKLATAAGATVASVLPGVVVAGTIVLGTPNHVLLRGFAVAVLLASALYAALFMLFSLATRRALILGLLYVILWEGVLSRLFAGTRVLSIREYSMAAAEAGAGGSARLIEAALQTGTAAVLAIVMFALTVAVTIRRLSALEVMEEV